jgi:hypothetical protein
MRYVPGGGLPRTVPKGRILVHNHIRHKADTPCGVNGFRAWTEPEAKLAEGKRIRCRCRWSGLVHYRIVLNPTGKNKPPPKT